MINGFARPGFCGIIGEGKEAAMDPVTAVYYAGICAALAQATSKLRSALLRVVTGAAVGLAAAAALPGLRGFFGL